MALINEGNHEVIMKNIDSALDTTLNVEGASPQGVFRLRQMANEIAALIKIREFVEGDMPTIKMPSMKKEGK